MSQRSPRNAKRHGAKVEGAKAPSISARLGVVEQFLQDYPHGVVVHRGLSDGGRDPLPPTGKTSIPPIKPRLEALIDKAGALNSRLELLNHIITGSNTPSVGSDQPTPQQPSGIPDHLTVLESYFLRALEMLENITIKF